MTPRRPSIGGKDLGDHAESVAQLLLSERGYNADLHRINNPVYDLAVEATIPFNVSVKASRTQQHVRLGSLRSVMQLSAGNFVFAFMPSLGRKEIALADGGYRLFIIPAEIAREDGIAIRDSYLALRGLDQSYSYSLMVKGYAKAGASGSGLVAMGTVRECVACASATKSCVLTVGQHKAISPRG